MQVYSQIIRGLYQRREKRRHQIINKTLKLGVNLHPPNHIADLGTCHWYMGGDQRVDAIQRANFSCF